MNKTSMKKILLFFFVASLSFTFCSCSDKNNEEDFTPTSLSVNGKAEKGPFVRGSMITMQTMDAGMNATGQTYTTALTDDAGTFSFGKQTFETPYAKLNVNGYFFNEVTGNLSTGTLSLNSIASLADQSSINVNILTHLKCGRVIKLMSDGKTFDDANTQAQKELLTAFGLLRFADTDVSKFSVASGTDEAAALIAVSSLVEANRTEAEIVEYLSKLSTEFTTNGYFSDASKMQLRKDRNYLNSSLENIANHIIERYNSLGSSIEVKDLAYFFDWDDNGIAGDEIESSIPSLDKSSLSVPKEGGDYTITINSDKPYYLSMPSTLEDGAVNNTYITSSVDKNLYVQGAASESIVMTKAITGNTIKVHVDAAKFRKAKTTTLPVYNARGKEIASISVAQEGNPNISEKVPDLGSVGEQMMNQIGVDLNKALYCARYLEEHHINQSSISPISSDNTDLSSAWSSFYRSINYILAMKNADAQMLNCYQEYLDTYLAVIYYTMTSYWGDVIYRTDDNPELTFNAARTSQNEIYNSLISSLTNAMPALEEKKNEPLTDYNKMLFVSKDVARIVLAKIYMTQGKYGDAKALLEKVVSNGYYSLKNSTTIDYADNSECVFALSQQNEITPCLDYKDAWLDLAECYHYTDNASKAKSFISEFCDKKGISASGSGVLLQIASIRKAIHSPYYLAFIRRNNLGKSVLGLTDSKLYQLLWPIPMSEMCANPSITQNPGY
jgi:tetratricopeptide (TPR) repeat protein